MPTYDRGRLAPAVVHVGVGGFHRAHQAMYFDRLAEHGVSDAWGVAGVGLRSGGMRAALTPQDCLYTLVERGPREDAVRVVGAIGTCLFAPREPGAVLRALASESTRLVTLTITGDGYHVDADGELLADHPAIVRDLRRPHRPMTAAGYLVEALDRRRRAGLDPFTVLSCDNVPGNGRVARAAVTGFARLRDPQLAAWIEERVAFPHSIVDRITPATTPAARSALAEEFGIDDRWPVTTEPFTQWVVEDDFCNRRPPLEDVGVQFVADVGPYELTKKRLLNGTHSAMAYLGYLAGHRDSAAVMTDPVFEAYLTRLMDAEIAPLVPAGADDTLDYARTVRLRLANPRMRDRLSRLGARGSTKLPAYLLPSLAEARAAGSPHPLLTLAVAGWMRYLRGADDRGRPIDVQDLRAERLCALAARGGDDPRPLLRGSGIFGDLAADEALADELATALRTLSRRGARAAVAAADEPALGVPA